MWEIQTKEKSKFIPGDGWPGVGKYDIAVMLML